MTREIALPAPAGANAADQPRAGRPLPLLLTASAGCAMTIFDTNVTAVVLPAIGRDLGSGFQGTQWVVSAYVLCFAALLLPAGAIADRLGRRRVLLAGSVLFALASAGCAVAPSIALLCLARCALGGATAFLLAPALAVIGHAFHGEDARTWAFAIWGTVMGLVMVVAPVGGGAVAGLAGWRVAVGFEAPAALLLGLATLCWIPESRDDSRRPLDPPGILLFAGTMLGITWGLINGPAGGWTSASTLAGFAGGALSGLGFLRGERRRHRPMRDLTLFLLPRFVGAVLAMGAYAAAAQGMASLLPLYLQNGRGRDALGAGLGMLPFGFAMLVTPRLVPGLGRYLSGRALLSLGLLVTGGGDLIVAVAMAMPSSLLLGAGLAVIGIGGGLLNGETTRAIVGAIPRDRAGMASGISTTARFGGILIGFSLLGTIAAQTTRLAIATGGTPDGTLAGIGVDAGAAPDDLASLVAAGRWDVIARTIPPDGADRLIGALHRAYDTGFSAAMTVAGVLALVAAVAVAVLTKTPGRPAKLGSSPIRR
ncbi:MAG: MFS transporter [Telmatospirillum sp.]|nr:MFS transporter [Telmatospirillum sp.]